MVPGRALKLQIRPLISLRLAVCTYPFRLTPEIHSEFGESSQKLPKQAIPVKMREVAK
jgi:hypothetical protein